MVGAATGKVHTPSCHAFNNGFVIHIHFHNVINLHTRVSQCFSLRDGARKSVKQASIGTIRLLQTLFDQTNDDVIRHQSACIHHLLRREP